MEINAITLAVTDMARSVRFYAEVLELPIVFGGPDDEFTSLSFGSNFINLFVGEPGAPGHWGRVIFHVDDPDSVHAILTAAGFSAEFAPQDPPWGERYFHVRDPDGHELSFARRL